MEQLNLIIMGPPGAGKGTQATKIADEYGIPHISTGDILRANKHMETDHGTPAEYIDNGEYVPDEVMVEILKKRLDEPDTADGFILDGFPRTMAQADHMEEIADTDMVLYLDVDRENIVERLTGRRTCEDCGTTYHTEYKPPPEPGTCACGGELKQREDDQEDVVKDRIETYHDKTQPVVAHYRDEGMLEAIDGNPGIEEVWHRIKQRIDAELDRD